MISAPVFCPRFIGRRPELAYLIERRRDLAKSHGGIVLVGGDAGIGKSRLLRAFLDASGTSRGRVALGRCRAFANAPYEPLTELLATLNPAAAALRPAESQAAQLSSIAAAFVEAAEKHAIVGIVEDLHWSDGGTLAVLALLSEQLATTRLLLLCTYRANELGPDHPHYIAFGALQRSRGVANVQLPPLSAVDAAEFIDATLHAAAGDVSLEVRRNVARVAEGNPFFTEELLRSVVDREPFRQNDAPLPMTVHAAIVERMQPLTSAERAILTQAAVIGRRFEANLLAYTLDAAVDTILPVLQRARALQIVEETSDPATFRFRHALTRAAIYDRLLSAQRRPLHRRIALALEAQAAWNSSPDALGYHWWAAGDRAKALEYGERCGDAAQALHGYADSIDSYERSLSFLSPESSDAARLHAKMGTSYFRSGFMDAAVEHYRQAWAFFATTTSDAPFSFRLARNLAAALYNDGRAGESTVFLRQAVDALASCGDRSVTARARVTFASYLADARDIEEARAVLLSIDAELAREDDSLAITFWQTTCRVCALQGDAGGVREAAERVYAIGEGSADPIALIDGLRESGFSAVVVGETAVARRCLSRASDLCAALELRANFGDLLAESALERVLSGEYEEARSFVVRALPLIGEVKTSRRGFVLAALAVGVALDDRELLGYEPDEAFIELAFETEIPFFFGPLAALCAPLLAARGEGDAAQRLLRRAVRCAAGAKKPFFGSFPLVVVAAQHCARTDADAVRTLCATTAGGGPGPKAAAELGEAILLRRFGKESAASAPARLAADGFAAVGWPLYESLALDAAGELPSARRIRERIGFRGGDPSRALTREGSPQPLLTPRELEVARLVAGGRTNREIANTLCVSVKLVEKNLSSIYAKLKLSSRSQLTVHMLAAMPPRSEPHVLSTT